MVVRLCIGCSRHLAAVLFMFAVLFYKQEAVSFDPNLSLSSLPEQEFIQEVLAQLPTIPLDMQR